MLLSRSILYRSRFSVKKEKVIEFIAAAFILLFVYTAASKLADLMRFKYFLSQSPLIGGMAQFLSIFIPLIELFISLLLFIPRTRKIGMWSSTLLMVAFTGYLGYMIATTKNLPCSCGGVISEMTWRQHLVFNIAFTLLGVVGIYLFKKIKFERP